MAEVKTDARRKRFAVVESEADDLAVKVYPMGYELFTLNVDRVGTVLRAISGMDFAKARESGVEGNAMIWAFAPLVTREMVQLVDASCVPKLSEVDAPVEFIVRAAIEWVRLSFTRGGLSALLQAAEGLLATLNDDGPSTPTPKPSPGSSDSGSASNPSSPANTPTGGRFQDGASSSSTPTVAPPSAS